MATTDDITRRIEDCLASAQHSAREGNWPYMKCYIDDALKYAKPLNLDLAPRVEKIKSTYYNLAINVTLSEAEKAVNGGKSEEASKYFTLAENYALSAGIDISPRISKIKLPQLQ